MHFLDGATGTFDAAPVELVNHVAGITHVHRWKCHFRSSRTGRQRTVSLLFFEREDVFEGLLDKLRHSVRMEGGIPVVVDEEHAHFLGRLLWSKLHPDIGVGLSAGRHAYLGKSRVFFKKFFRWLAPLTPSKDLWSTLAEHGERMALPSFSAWKTKQHFGDGAVLPAKKDIAEADRFLDAVAVEVAQAECRHRMNPRWLGNEKNRRLPEEFYKAVRRNSQALVKKHDLSLEAERAATLLSYADAARFGIDLAKKVLQALPEKTLNRNSRRIFKLMWTVPKVGVDDRGRYDIPIMASPALASALEYVMEVDDDGTARDKENIVADLLDFAMTGERNRGVNIALGFSFFFRRWLDDNRNAERERTQQRLGVLGRHVAEQKHRAKRTRPAKRTTAPTSE